MRKTLSVGLATLLLLAASCSSKAGNGAGDATTSEVTETTGPVATSPSTATTATTLGAAPPPGAIPVIQFPSGTPGDGVSPEGSGCSPGTAPTLPDGTWFGILATTDPAAGTLGLDLACVFLGDAADAAATADGAAEVPVPNGVWVRNQNPAVYTAHVVPGVAVGLLQHDGGSAEFEPTMSGLAAAAPAIGRPVWVEIVAGWVVAIQQQYFP